MGSSQRRFVSLLLLTAGAGAVLGAWLMAAADSRGGERQQRQVLLAVMAELSSDLQALPTAAGAPAPAEVLRMRLGNPDLRWLAIYGADGLRIAVAGRHDEPVPERLQTLGGPRTWWANDHLWGEYPGRLADGTSVAVLASSDVPWLVAARRRAAPAAAAAIAAALLLTLASWRTLWRQLAVAGGPAPANQRADERASAVLPGAWEGSPELQRVGASYARMLDDLERRSRQVARQRDLLAAELGLRSREPPVAEPAAHRRAPRPRRLAGGRGRSGVDRRDEGAGSAPSPRLDPARLAGLESRFDDTARAELVNVFELTSARQVATLREVADDVAALAATAHLLAGVASDVGAVTLAGLAAELELAARARRGDRAAAALEQLPLEREATLLELRSRWGLRAHRSAAQQLGPATG